jgi:hypothetical protein
MRMVLRVILAFGLMFAIAARPGRAADSPLQDFFGHYAGRTISEAGAGLSERDLNVAIRPWQKGKGFTLEWTTVIRRRADETRRQSYSINFQPSARPSIYGAAMRSDMFGGQGALDPLKGDPYVWARIDEDTLTVHSLLITEEGGYEMQVVDRTLTPEGGLRLTFSRIRDGHPLKVIHGTLQRIGD